MKLTGLPADYPAFLASLKERILGARTDAARAVHREMILLYWDIGEAIAGKQREANWGDAVVERLAFDLRSQFPHVTGFSTVNVWRMRRFAAEHTSPEFLAQVAREMAAASGNPRSAFLSQAVIEMKNPAVAPTDAQFLSQAVRELVAAVPWGHHANVLARIADPAARLYYLRATGRFGWTRKVLLNQVKARAYEATLAQGKSHNFPATLPATLADQAEEALKSRYSLEFLGIHREVKEREIEERLLSQIQRFILELGYGFCFIGRQHRLMLGRKEYFIDLLFYHRFLKALIAIDLKIGPFEPEHAGKMDFYLNLLDEKERGPGDNPSIGIILCAEKDSLEVEFALRSKTNPIGVAEYELVARLPADLKGKLPTASQLAAALKPALPESPGSRRR